MWSPHCKMGPGIGSTCWACAGVSEEDNGSKEQHDMPCSEHQEIKDKALGFGANSSQVCSPRQLQSSCLVCCCWAAGCGVHWLPEAHLSISSLPTLTTRCQKASATSPVEIPPGSPLRPLPTSGHKWWCTKATAPYTNSLMSQVGLQV